MRVGILWKARASGVLRFFHRFQLSNPPSSRIRIRIGFGKAKVSAISPAKPTNQTQGESAAIARPPSRGSTGSRLKRLMKKPT